MFSQIFCCNNLGCWDTDSWNLPAGRLVEIGDVAAMCRRWSLFSLARLMQKCSTFYCIDDSLSALADFIKKINCYSSRDNVKELPAVP